MRQNVKPYEWRRAVHRWLLGDVVGSGDAGEIPKPPRGPAFRALLAWLAEYADYRTGDGIRPGVATIARLLDVHPSTVKRALNSALDAGILTRTGGHNPHQPNRYALCVPEWLKGTTTHGFDDAEVAERDHEDSERDHESPERDHDTTPINDQSLPGGQVSGDSVSRTLPPSVRPSPYCSKHPNGTETPCGPCGGARRARAEWDGQAEVEKSRRNQAPRVAEALSDDYCESCGAPSTQRHLVGCIA